MSSEVRKAKFVKFTAHGDKAEVTISVKWRESPESQDYDDGNWLVCGANITVPGFKSSFDFNINAPALADFLSQLKRMTATLSGSASFTPMEPSISLVGEITN